MTKQVRRCGREGNWKWFCGDHKAFPLCAIIFFVGIYSAVLTIWGHYNPSVPKEFELVRGPNGELIQRASLSDIEEELASETSDLYWEAREPLLKAEEASGKGQSLLAAELYVQSFDKLPAVTSGLNAAVAYLLCKKYNESISIIERALKLSTRNTKPEFTIQLYFVKGLAEGGGGNFLSAAEDFKKTSDLSSSEYYGDKGDGSNFPHQDIN